MSITIPQIEPDSVNAGDTLRWQRLLALYPANDGWALSYTLLNAVGRISIGGIASGTAHMVHVPAATSASWAAGDYAWRAQVQRAGEVFTVGEGRMEVRASFNAATLETRSWARRALEAVEAFLADPSNIRASEYEIAGRKLRRYSIPDLWVHRDRLRAEVAREDAAARLGAGLPDRRKLFVRFGP